MAVAAEKLIGLGGRAMGIRGGIGKRVRGGRMAVWSVAEEVEATRPGDPSGQGRPVAYRGGAGGPTDDPGKTLMVGNDLNPAAGMKGKRGAGGMAVKAADRSLAAGEIEAVAKLTAGQPLPGLNGMGRNPAGGMNRPEGWSVRIAARTTDQRQQEQEKKSIAKSGHEHLFKSIPCSPINCQSKKIDLEVYADVARRLLRKEQARPMADGILSANPLD